AFDADERRGIAQLAQATRHLLSNELAIGEDLEVAVRMSRQQVEQLRMHERLAAKQAEEGVAVSLGVRDGAAQRVQVDGILLLDVDPATLAAQVAGIENGEVKKRRKVFTAAQATFEPLD